MMSEIILLLKRTVFLPKGSPGICNVREITADIRHYEVAADKGRVFCSGEADLLIEYLSFAAGRQYPGYEAYEQRLADGGSMWQALLTIPFELVGEGELPCPPLAELSPGRLDWFMVSPHALEMSMQLRLSWRETAGGTEGAAARQQSAGWRQITLADVEAGDMGINELRTAKTKKEECLNMEHDDKIMRLGVSDQGWQITSWKEKAGTPEAAAEAAGPTGQQTSLLEAAIQEIARPQPAVTEKTVIEETVAEEIIVEETVAKEVVAKEVVAKEAAAQEVVTEEVVAVEVVAEEVIVEEAVAEEVIAEEVIVEEAVVEEVLVEEVVVEEVVSQEAIITEAVAEAACETITAAEEIVAAPQSAEPLNITGAPLLNIQTVETLYQPPVEPNMAEQAPAARPPETAYPATRRRAAGLPRLQVRHEQIRSSSSFQVNYRVDDKRGKE